MKRAHRIILLATLALLAILLTVVILVLAPSTEPEICADYKIKIANKEYQFLNENKIESLLQASGMRLKNMPINEINLVELEATLERHPFVENAVCYFTPRGELCINVHQRVPLFKVISAQKSYYVDVKREIMPLSSSSTAFVPVVTGRVNESFAANQLFDVVYFITQNSFYANKFTQIHITEGQEIILVPRVGDYLIKLGDGERYKQRLEKWRTFVKEWPKYKSWSEYSVVDLRFRDQVVCKRKDK